MSRKKCRKLQEQYISYKRLDNYTNYREYIDNIKLSKDFYIPLSIVEISCRNALNRFYISRIGKDWLQRDYILQLDAQRNIQKTTKMLRLQNKTINNHMLISELNFGFWVKLLTKAYTPYLRYNDLKQIFPNLPSSKNKSINRHIIFTKLNNIRLFRNKFFYHDKIINKEEYSNMMEDIYESLSCFDNEIVDITKNLNK